MPLKVVSRLPFGLYRTTTDDPAITIFPSTCTATLLPLNEMSVVNLPPLPKVGSRSPRRGESREDEERGKEQLRKAAHGIEDEEHAFHWLEGIGWNGGGEVRAELSSLP